MRPNDALSAQPKMPRSIAEKNVRVDPRAYDRLSGSSAFATRAARYGRLSARSHLKREQANAPA